MDLYGLMSILTALALAHMWLYGTHHHRLVDARLDTAHIRYVPSIMLLTPAVFLISVVVSFVSVPFAMYCWDGVFIVGYVARRKATGPRPPPRWGAFLRAAP
ncbi:MAG: hypothetical protein ACYDFT_03815 [Thermoplasmata archaeon]